MTAVATPDTVATFTESARTAHNEALELIRRAHRWANGEDLTWDQIKDGQGEVIVEQRRAKVREMELSYFTNLATVLTMWTGGMRVWRDSEACLIWSHDSGFTGGLIFSRDLSLSQPGEPLTIGTWSLHS